MNASESANAERREHTRHTARFVVSIETATRVGHPGGFGIAKNASAGGVLFNTPSHYEKGEELMLTILFPTRMPIRVKAHVVRVEKASVALPWRCVAAAQFEEPQPDLESILAGLAWD